MKSLFEVLQKNKKKLVLTAGASLLILAIVWWRTGSISPKKIVQVGQETIDQTTNLFGGEFKINESKFSVDPAKLRSGGPPKDGIPAIDDPKFVTPKEASFLAPDDIVFGIVHNGEARAYPAKILVWHEIVNDTVAGDPILVTYCPLCLTAIAFERKIDGIETTFGTSGKLYNSNLVMYNRINDQIKTENFWTQLGGEAIVGDLTGRKLKQITIDTVKWSDWLKKHPQSLVLSTDTGFARNYGVDPYGDYYTTPGLIAPVENQDDRLFEKAVVFGITINDKAKAYSEEALKRNPAFEDRFAGKTLEVSRNEDGSVRVIDKSTKEEIPTTISFWFSWVAFYPETELAK